MQRDREKIFDLFAHRTRMVILSIPLQQNTATRDVLIWKENKSQSFSVKSAYQVVKRMKEQTLIEHSTATTEKPLWRKLWKINVLPKVSMFLWCACSNILPTRENLHRRRVQVDPRCQICCQQPETVGHLLWECPLARNVWAQCRGGIQKCQNDLCDFFHLFWLLEKKLSRSDLEKWAVTSWAIWNARNKFYFEKTQSHPSNILKGAIGYLQGYQQLSVAQQNSRGSRIGWASYTSIGCLVVVLRNSCFASPVLCTLKHGNTSDIVYCLIILMKFLSFI